MKKIKEKWPLYLVNLLSGLALAYFVLMIITLMNFGTGGTVTDTATAYRYEEDPDSAYLNSLDDLPHREYRRQKDSINFIQLQYTHPFVSGFVGRPVGVGFCRECDTCTYTDRRIDYFGRGIKRYYLLIGGFTLPGDLRNRLDPPLFYKKQGVSYMKSIRWDTLQTGPQKGHLLLHWVNKKIPYRVRSGIHPDEDKKQVMIPVSHSVYKIMTIASYILMGIILLLYIYTGRCFVLVLLEVARGKAFTIKNYRRLFYIAGIITLFPITSLVTQVVLQWSYRSYYTGDLLPDFDWGKKISWLLAALVVFLLALAFRKGYRIQQEQELTI